MTEKDCIFCKIISGDLPASRIYETPEVLVFLDIKPVNIGHSLVIPKKHYKNIYETPEDVLAHMITAAKVVSNAMKEKLFADGINVTMNNDHSAGQVIFHSHMHIIPRFAEDGFGLWQGKRDYQAGEREEVARKISSAL